MSRIAVIADTDSSLPADVAAQHQIALVPIKIQFGTESYDTGSEINDHELFARVNKENKLPTTAAPAPGRYIEFYQQAFDAGADEIICITISSKMSASHMAAMTAAQSFPDKPIHVVDSHTLGMAQGFMALKAADMAASGATADEILLAVKSVLERSQLYGALATLKYLAMSGRVGHVAAGLASLLNIRPILSVRDGELQLLEKIRTQRLAWERVIELTRQGVGDKPIEQLAFMHVDAPEDCARFAEQFRMHLNCPQDSLTVELTPGLSVHTGAGMVGVVVISAA